MSETISNALDDGNPADEVNHRVNVMTDLVQRRRRRRAVPIVDNEGNPIPDGVNVMTDVVHPPEVREEIAAALQDDSFFAPLLEVYGAEAIVNNVGMHCMSDVNRFKPLTAAKLTALSIHRRYLGPGNRLDGNVTAFLARLAEHLAGDEPVLKELLMTVEPETDWPWQVIEWTVCWHEQKVQLQLN